jgi:hypothetical protein
MCFLPIIHWDFYLTHHIQAGSSKEEKANQGQYDLTADENEAERISTGFTKLRADVGSFCVRLKQAVTDAELGMQQEVTNLQAKVNELQAKLDGYTTAVSRNSKFMICIKFSVA